MRPTRTPFGQADCEAELHTLQEGKYAEMFFTATPFSDAATRPETYLIIGRRGSGKTALAQYLRFQSDLPDPIYIQVDEPALFQEVLLEVAGHLSENHVVVISEFVQIWTYLLWNLVFEHLRGQSAAIASVIRTPSRGGSDLIRVLLTDLLPRLRGLSPSAIHDHVGDLTDAAFDAARDAALRLARSRPIIIVLDTLEKYDTRNDALMNATAALIDCAALFNRRHSDDGIHVKVFMAGEIFPYLQ